jgi:CRP-like cAMP-binding protein
MQTVVGRRIESSEIASIPAGVYIEKLLENVIISSKSEGFSYDKYKVLGRVDESPDLVHILIRLFVRAQESSFDNVQIYSFSQTEEGWRMLTPQTLKQLLLVTSSKR